MPSPAYKAPLRAGLSLFLALFFRQYLIAQEVDWPSITFTPVITNRFQLPVAVTHSGDGSGRLFIVERRGSIWQISSNRTAPEIFFNFTDRLRSSSPEQGLLGLTFSPGFATNRTFYICYTDSSSNVVLARFQALADLKKANVESGEVLLSIPKPRDYHNGGHIAFGPDGYLYMGVGDGGPEGDPFNNAQNKSLLLGKILRLDVENRVTGYGIPTNNPFVGDATVRPEIWAYGLRNPWRFSFDRATGDLYIGDVGQERFEEINFQAAGSGGGQNYGWRIREGNDEYLSSGFTNLSALTPPIVTYRHADLPQDVAVQIPSGSVTGGIVSRGPNAGRLADVYLYSDFSACWHWGMKRTNSVWHSASFVTPGITGSPKIRVSSYGEDEEGRVYVCDYSSGAILEVKDSGQAIKPILPNESLAERWWDHYNVAITTLTPGAEIHYTLTNVDPTVSDPVVPPSGVITVTNAGFSLRARAFRSDLQPSDVSSAYYILRPAPLVFDPPPGPVSSNTLVTIRCATPGAAIHFETNGANATISSPIFSSPMKIERATSVRAMAEVSGITQTISAAAQYTIAATARPVATTNSIEPIILSCATPGAEIHYTLDGTPPNRSSALYTEPFVVIGEKALRAIAYAPDYLASPILAAPILLPPSTVPSFAPQGGPLIRGSSIAIVKPSPESEVFFTVDGSSPTTNSTRYIEAISFEGPFTLRARAKTPGRGLSEAVTVFFGELIHENNYVVSTLAGSPNFGYVDGPQMSARFNKPSSICADTVGNLFVADTGNHAVRKISTDGVVSTLGAEAGFVAPIGICIDPEGNLYVAERGNCSRISRIAADGSVTVIGHAAVCELPEGLRQIAFGPDGALYAGYRNSVIRISMDGQVRVIVSGGSWGYDLGVAVDTKTNLFVAASRALFDVSLSGSAELHAGGISTRYSDGLAASAGFDFLWHVALDTKSNIFLADQKAIRKIQNQNVTTIAGGSLVGYRNGPGKFAKFNWPSSICVDAAGNIFVADSLNHSIRKLTLDSGAIGIADEWQLRYFGNIGIDPEADPDSDGIANLGEFWTGSNPNDSASSFKISVTGIENAGEVELRWASIPGLEYEIQSSTDLNAWTGTGISMIGDGEELRSRQAVSRLEPLYFRIRIPGL